METAFLLTQVIELRNSTAKLKKRKRAMAET
jgi:hypothetical protein